MLQVRFCFLFTALLATLLSARPHPAARPVVVRMGRLLPSAAETHAPEVTFRITFSLPVRGVDGADFILTALKGEATGRVSAVRAARVPSATWDVTVSGITREVRLRLDLKGRSTGITDARGIALGGGFTEGPSYDIEDPLPFVAGITRQAPRSPVTSAEAVTFRVVFCREVRGVDPDDFYTTALSGDVRGSLAGLAREPTGDAPLPVLTPVDQEGTTYDVTVHAIRGTGRLGLEVKPGGTGIRDNEGRPLFGGISPGETYTFRPPADPFLTSLADLSAVAVAKNTGEKPQGKVWTYAGKWWSVLATPSGTRIFRLDGTSWTPVLQVSEEQEFHADCRVAGAVSHLLLFRENAESYLVSVEYDRATDRYRLWKQRPAAVKMNFEPGAETATLALDGKGRLWIAYAATSEVLVRWSEPPFSKWEDDIRIARGITDDDICAITPLPGGIGVLWSNQEEQRFGFRTHRDGEAPDRWSKDEEPAAQWAKRQGNGFADDHLNVVCAANGTLYCAVKTSYDTPGYPKLSLLVRPPAGGWGFYPVTSVEGTRGIVVLNEAARRLKVVYCTQETGGDMVYRETALTRIAFGPPRTLISGPFLFNEASSTHQPTRGEVVILATKQDTEPKQAVGVLARDGKARPGDPPPSGDSSKQESGCPPHLQVYPNPAGVRSMVRFPLPAAGTYRLALYDQKGAMVEELQGGQGTAGQCLTLPLDCRHLPGGVYLLRLHTASGIQTVKLVVHP
ncbi:T9SS type A sorting domain-containing protein [Paraflavisolibacter sp. H34]|uniref:T9SS type A sorting domain-containing protein n=1 Tax=Huijunlia imazamoxiresistens TaxID=3127457 RepID=UPI00301AF721